jgi:hypothetical protein
VDGNSDKDYYEMGGDEDDPDLDLAWKCWILQGQ